MPLTTTYFASNLNGDVFGLIEWLKTTDNAIQLVNKTTEEPVDLDHLTGEEVSEREQVAIILNSKLHFPDDDDSGLHEFVYGGGIISLNECAEAELPDSSKVTAFLLSEFKENFPARVHLLLGHNDYQLLQNPAAHQDVVFTRYFSVVQTLHFDEKTLTLYCPSYIGPELFPGVDFDNLPLGDYSQVWTDFLGRQIIGATILQQARESGAELKSEEVDRVLEASASLVKAPEEFDPLTPNRDFISFLRGVEVRLLVTGDNAHPGPARKYLYSQEDIPRAMIMPGVAGGDDRKDDPNMFISNALLHIQNASLRVSDAETFSVSVTHSVGFPEALIVNENYNGGDRNLALVNHGVYMSRLSEAYTGEEVEILRSHAESENWLVYSSSLSEHHDLYSEANDGRDPVGPVLILYKYLDGVDTYLPVDSTSLTEESLRRYTRLLPDQELASVSLEGEEEVESPDHVAIQMGEEAALSPTAAANLLSAEDAINATSVAQLTPPLTEEASDDLLSDHGVRTDSPVEDPRVVGRAVSSSYESVTSPLERQNGEDEMGAFLHAREDDLEDLEGSVDQPPVPGSAHLMLKEGGNVEPYEFTLAELFPGVDLDDLVNPQYKALPAPRVASSRSVEDEGGEAVFPLNLETVLPDAGDEELVDKPFDLDNVSEGSSSREALVFTPTELPRAPEYSSAHIDEFEEERLKEAALDSVVRVGRSLAALESRILNEVPESTPLAVEVSPTLPSDRETPSSPPVARAYRVVVAALEAEVTSSSTEAPTTEPTLRQANMLTRYRQARERAAVVGELVASRHHRHHPAHSDLDVNMPNARVNRSK